MSTLYKLMAYLKLLSKIVFLAVIALHLRGAGGSTKTCYTCLSDAVLYDPDCETGHLGDRRVTNQSTPSPIDGTDEYCVYEIIFKNYIDNARAREVTYKRYKRSININYGVPPTCSVLTKTVHRAPAFKEISELRECSGEKCNNLELKDPNPPPSHPPPRPPTTHPRPGHVVTSSPTPRPSGAHCYNEPFKLLALTTIGFLITIALVPILSTVRLTGRGTTVPL